MQFGTKLVYIVVRELAGDINIIGVEKKLKNNWLNVWRIPKKYLPLRSQTIRY